MCDFEPTKMFRIITVYKAMFEAIKSFLNKTNCSPIRMQIEVRVDPVVGKQCIRRQNFMLVNSWGKITCCWFPHISYVVGAPFRYHVFVWVDSLTCVLFSSELIFRSMNIQNKWQGPPPWIRKDMSLLFNPLNPELNPMCCLLALVGTHHFLHVSRIRVKSLTLGD